jgi:hypothetical protein
MDIVNKDWQKWKTSDNGKLRKIILTYIDNG